MKKSRSSGVGNSENDTWHDTLTIKLDRGLEFTAYVGFTEGLEDAGFGLLGQDGFFSKYDVLFSHIDAEFCIYTRGF